VERAVVAVDPVQVAHQPPDAVVRRIVEQVPVERGVVVPFALLRELAAHEEELLAGMPPHEAVVGAQVGEALPAVAGHLGQERALAVHHLVMAERQDEILGEGVVDAEGHLVVMMLPVDRVLRHVGERVVHPAHVPLEREAEPILLHRPGHAGQAVLSSAMVTAPGARSRTSRFVPRRKSIASRFSRPPWRFGIHSPSVPRIVEVEHRGDRIDPQRVDVELLEPVDRVRAQEVRDLPPPEVVDERVPVAVEAQARVLVLVERGAVEPGEAVLVRGEMRGHPVEDHADPGAVQAVDHRGEVGVACRSARGGGEEADGLVAPGAGEGMFRDGQELHMGEAHLGHMLDQEVGRALA
jgi:hypothetical protein